MTVKGASKGEPLDITEAIKQVLDSVALLTHANCELNQCCRDLIRLDLKSYQQICAEHVGVTGFLFGDDLPQKIKGVNTTNRLGH